MRLALSNRHSRLSVFLVLRLLAVIFRCQFRHHFLHVLYFCLQIAVRFFQFAHGCFQIVKLAVHRHQKWHNIFQRGLSFSLYCVISGGLQSGWCRPGSHCSVLSSCCLSLMVGAPDSSPHHHWHISRRSSVKNTIRINSTMTPCSQSTVCCQHKNSHGQSKLCPSVQEASVSEHKMAGNLKYRNTEDTVTVNTK